MLKGVRDDGKIAVTFTEGKTRTLREMLWAIDGRRTAYFVFDNGRVYKGQTDGGVDEDGDFALKQNRSTIPGVLNRSTIQATCRLGLQNPKERKNEYSATIQLINGWTPQTLKDWLDEGCMRPGCRRRSGTGPGAER